MENDRKIYEQVNAVQEYVRQHLEDQFEGYRVTELVMDVKSRYVQPLHALTEDPDFIQKSIVAKFYAFMANKEWPVGEYRCWALLGTDGSVRSASLEHIIHT